MKLADLEVMGASDDVDILASGDNAAIIFDQFLRALQLPDNDSVSKLMLEKLRQAQFRRDELPLVKAYYDLIQSRRRGAKDTGILRFINRSRVK